jgi:hypothetical protein
VPDERDDYDDPPTDRRPRRASNPAAAIIVILVGVALLLVVACAGAVGLFWFRAAGPAAPPAAAVVAVNADAGATRRIYDRAEFMALILQANRESVRDKVGAPSKGVELGPPEVWHYAGVTRDPATGTVDLDAAVVFQGGLVAEVRFVAAADPKGGGK